MKSKVDKLGVNKLVPVPVDLSKLGVVKSDVYNAKIKNSEDKMPDITNLATKLVISGINVMLLMLLMLVMLLMLLNIQSY